MTCLLGEDSWSEALLDKLVQSEVKEVIFAFKHHDEVSEYLIHEGICCYQADILNRNTVEEVLSTGVNAGQMLKHMLDSAEFIGGGHFTANPSFVSSSELDYQIKGDDIFFNFDDHNSCIRGLDRNKSYDCLRVNIQLLRGDFFYTDTLDLLHAKNRSYFVKQCSKETGLSENLIKKEIGKILMKLEDIQQERISGTGELDKTPKMSEQEREEALKYLKDEKLVDNIVEDFEEAGLLVGKR